MISSADRPNQINMCVRLTEVVGSEGYSYGVITYSVNDNSTSRLCEMASEDSDWSVSFPPPNWQGIRGTKDVFK
jgi:hypothetical protein